MDVWVEREFHFEVLPNKVRVTLNNLDLLRGGKRE